MNEERKRDFIMSQTPYWNTRVFLTDLFDFFAPYENEWGCDLVMQSAALLKPSIDKLMENRTTVSSRDAMYYLRSYAKWCALSGYGVCNGIFDVEDKITETSRRKMVASPYHLKCVLEYFFGKPESRDIGVIYRSFFYLAYMGLSNETILSLTTQDVITDRMVVVVNGKEYRIHSEAFEDLCLAKHLEAFNREGPLSTCTFQRFNSNLLLRTTKRNLDMGFAAEKISKRMRDPKMKDARAYFPKYPNMIITPKSIFDSGFFYRLHQKELASIALDFHQYAQENISQRVDAEDFAKLQQSRKNYLLNMETKNINIEYEQWKHTFVR